MISSLTILLFGFLLGMRHALETDHVAAVSSMATAETSILKAVRLGAVWGLGHTITLSLFGSIVILTDLFIPDHLSRGLEFVVGGMLVILGVLVIHRLIHDKVHFHVHRHADGTMHLHAHSHAGESSHNPKLHQHEHRKFPLHALAVGMMHGMAGSAVLILMTLQTVHSPVLSVAYMLLFGVGSILGMAVLSIIISVPLRMSAKSESLTWVNNSLCATVGSGTIILGIYKMYENGGIFL